MQREVAGWGVWGAGLALLLVGGGGCMEDAQRAPDVGTARRAAASPQADTTPATRSAPSAAEVSELWHSVATLRAEVAELRREVDSLRARTPDTSGTGGSGSGGAPPRGVSAGDGVGGSGSEGAARNPPGVSEVPPAGTNVPAPTGKAVVTATFSGVVRSVSPSRVVLTDDSGEPLPLSVEDRTKVTRGGKSIGVRELKPGERVRAVVDMLGDHQTELIVVLPKSNAEE
ncbi:hypothetical protein LY474_29020 [Myxococcus stipitatus]|uniref:hypothetical protein n=1 Tax=Myxococcus stipitatus TaxID=83455 RepID=UPI001F21A123|nr:hypothetical protein [Myxococcus stipitatus]MCE9671854.1 hypothetical protein [Myxococcus stipitatus]